MGTLVDMLSGLYRCECGRLYKDYRNIMHKCDKCRTTIDAEWKQQKTTDGESA